MQTAVRAWSGLSPPERAATAVGALVLLCCCCAAVGSRVRAHLRYRQYRVVERGGLVLPPDAFCEADACSDASDNFELATRTIWGGECFMSVLEVGG